MVNFEIRCFGSFLLALLLPYVLCKSQTALTSFFMPCIL